MHNAQCIAILMRNLTSCRQASMGASGWQGKVFWPALARKQLVKFKANLR